MLRWLAVLAILFGVTFTSPANSGKENKRSNLAQNNGNNNTSPSPTVINNQACPPNKESTNTHPPHWYVSPEWWLCILGLPTLIFIGWQAKATADAAEATKESAKAARDSIGMLQRKERGRVRVDLTQPDVHPVTLKTMANISLYGLQIQIVLDGSSEAVIIESKELGRICKNGVEPSVGRLIKTNWPRVVNSQNSPVKQFCTCFVDEGGSLNAGINKELTDELRKGDWYFLYEAYFRYRDVFGDIWISRIKQRFNFVVLPDEVRAMMTPEILTGRWDDVGEAYENSEIREASRQKPN